MVCSSSTFTVEGGAREKRHIVGAREQRGVAALVVPTRTGGPLAALGGGGREAGFGPPTASSAEADPRTLRGDDSAGEGGWWRRNPGLVGVHPGIQRYDGALVFPIFTLYLTSFMSLSSQST